MFVLKKKVGLFKKMRALLKRKDLDSRGPENSVIFFGSECDFQV